MIYLLEDDESIRNFVLYTLNNTGLEAEGFEKPSDFWAALNKKIPELLLLDIMLPEQDGLDILARLRSRSDTAAMPIIMLTAKGAEYDKIIGLDSGADDYVTKPFSMMELVSRIKALLRRTAGVQAKNEFAIGGLYVNIEKHIVRANGKDVTLTYKEFELLCLLVQNQGTVFTRSQILERIWGYEFDGENRTVDVHIRMLRSKLGECKSLIETVRGIGYKLGASDE